MVGLTEFYGGDEPLVSRWPSTPLFIIAELRRSARE